MKRQPSIMAGTALGLLMASVPLSAAPLSPQIVRAPFADRIILAQAECPEGEECAPAEAEQPRRERRQRQQQQEEQPQAEPEQQAEPEAEQPTRAQRRQRQQEEQQQAEPEAKPQAEPEARPQAEPEQQAEPEAQPEPQAAPEQPAEPEAQPQAAPEPEAEQPTRAQRRQRQQQQEEQQQETPAEAPQPEAAPEAPASAEQPAAEPEAAPAAEPDAAAPATQPDAAPAEQPASGQSAPAEQPAATTQPTSPDETPLFDSQKTEPAAAQDGQRRQGQGDGQRRPRNGQQGGQNGQQQGEAAPQQPPVEQGPPPADDRAAQEAAQPAEIRDVREEKGERRERPRDEDFSRRERPDGVDVLREIGDRVIINLGGETIVQSNERGRISRGARDVYYEDLPRGRVRETIVRENGVQIVTIRDRYGDVIQRSRIGQDGREYILNYVDEERDQDLRDWRDPGDDLPPIRINIPRDEYILDAEQVDDPDDYYEFLEQPPVEKVERLYSVDEVKRSARVRDIARRVDLDTLTFEFGSASIPEAEVNKLEGVAGAMEKLLEKNPAETFLIEGHTDAVGSDVANLALSDRRAEAVADALTNVFAIPPENLSTQGYGERYLKVKTDVAERDNRRVAIRRITALVAPVASAQ